MPHPGSILARVSWSKSLHHNISAKLLSVTGSQTLHICKYDPCMEHEYILIKFSCDIQYETSHTTQNNQQHPENNNHQTPSQKSYSNTKNRNEQQTKTPNNTESKSSNATHSIQSQFRKKGAGGRGVAVRIQIEHNLQSILWCMCHVECGLGKCWTNDEPKQNFGALGPWALWRNSESC